MKLSITTIALALITVCLGMTSTFAQKTKPVPAYKIAAINVTPFDEDAGKFADQLAADDGGAFGNALSTSLFVTIEVDGTPGEFVAGRDVKISVTEGKKVKIAKTGYLGVFNESGKYFVPVWLYGPMCDTVKITASMIGQTTKSTKTRSLSFHCGE